MSADHHPHSALPSTHRTAYYAAEGFVDELRDELGDVIEEYGRLLVAPGPMRPAAWAQNVWLDPHEISIASIGDAAKKLRALDPRKTWSLAPHSLHRRASLIEEKLPRAKSREIEFLGQLPASGPGSWLLIDENRLLASAACTSLFANGEIRFHENKTVPPSRAYLKLWELFTVHGVRPSAKQVVVDAGASPGGWTWVLSEIGCKVVSIDKAPLAPNVASSNDVHWFKGDAFAVKPEQVVDFAGGKVDWFFSDIICEPSRLESLIAAWRESGLVRNFVCTIKFKGQTDHAVARRLASISDSRLRHLFHNKHELTWWLTPFDSTR